MCAVVCFMLTLSSTVPLHLEVSVYFCCICHQSTLTSGCTWIHSAFFNALSLRFAWSKRWPSFQFSHFLNLPPSLFLSLHCSGRQLSSASERSQVSQEQGSVPLKWMDSVSCSLQPFISVSDIVPRMLIEINSLDTDAHLWGPTVLFHVHTVNRIFFNCFPNWDEIFGNQVEHLM